MTRPRRLLRTETKTMERLRARAKAITTLAQFEEIIASANEDNRPAIRRLMEPMLSPNLPCCGPAMLSARMHESPLTHGALCPEARLVKLWVN